MYCPAGKIACHRANMIASPNDELHCITDKEWYALTCIPTKGMTECPWPSKQVKEEDKYEKAWNDFSQNIQFGGSYYVSKVRERFLTTLKKVGLK